MSTRRFVSGSSILLAAWLGATFINEVPTQRYPKLDKEALSADPTKQLEAFRHVTEAETVLTVSVSR